MISDDQRRPRMMSVPVFRDTRGSLLPLETGILPFKLARIFFIRDVPAGAKRGGHPTACHQFLFAIAGACSVVADGGEGGPMQVILEAWRDGLYAPEGTWVELSSFRDHAVVAVACSERYRPRGEERR